MAKAATASATEIAEQRFQREVLERFGVPPVGIVPDTVAEGLQQESAEKDDGGANIPGIYNPSGGWKCMRNAYYAFYRYNPDAPGDGNGVMRLGTLEELEIERLLKIKYGRFIKNDFPVLVLVLEGKEPDTYEIELPSEDPDFRPEGWFYKGKRILLMVRGYTDYYLAGYNGRVRVMWENKSAARVGGKKSASDHHAHQLSLYWKASKAEAGRMVYSSRNDLLDMVEIELDTSELEALFLESVQYFVEFHDFVVSKTLPPDEPKMPEWECRYCPFVKQCKKDGGKPRV